MTNQVIVRNAMLRQNFLSFVQKCFYELNPSEQFINGFYIELLCDHIQRMISGEKQKQIINLPPRYLKSVMCSVALPAFILGHDASAKIMCISYGDELASKLAADCKTIMETEWYKEVFPHTRIRTDKKSVMDFETTNHGGRFSTTVFGAVTGRGADWIILDDPLKPADALSDTMREKVNETYGNTILSRLNNKNTGRILLVMQRLHKHDLSGFLQENDSDFNVIKLPIIAEEDEIWDIKNHITQEIKRVIRKKGELLHPEREGMNIIDTYRNSMGLQVFSAQYQQNPMSIGSGIIKKEWLKYYDKLPMLNAIILSWDTAAKISDTSAYSACVVIGIGADKKIYLLEVFRKRLEFPALVQKVREMSQKYEMKASGRVITLIEDASSGTQLCQAVRNSIQRLIPCVCRGAKENRFNIVCLKIECGDLLFPSNYNAWFKDFEDELVSFPNSLFKDQCDALSQALIYYQESPIISSPCQALAATYREVIGVNQPMTNSLADYGYQLLPNGRYSTTHNW